MTTRELTNRDHRSDISNAGDRAVASVGHVVAIVINLVLLYVARNLGEWDLVPFLTADYALVVDAISISIIATIIGRVLRLIIPGRRFGLFIDGVVTAIGFFALLRMFQVFPFEFDPDGFRWDVVTRFVLIVGLFGSAVGALVTPLRLLQDRRQP